MFQVSDATHGPFATVVLSDEKAGSRATVIAERGALVTSLVVAGRERLYLEEATLLDPKQNVRGGIPVLFPTPGKLAGDAFAQLGAAGSMKQHGFARTSAFTETARGTDDEAWVTLELADSATTRAQFPFAFRLRLRFGLAGPRLTIGAEIASTVGAVPFALGYHPYFAVAAAEKATARLPTRATRAWDNVAKREIALDGIDLASGEVDLHLLDHASTEAALQLPTGDIELGGDFTRWVVWTLPGKEFVCVEPWTAPANAMNTGENLMTLEPGTSRRLDFVITAR